MVLRLAVKSIVEEPADLGIDVLAGERITGGPERIPYCREAIDRRSAAVGFLA